MQIIIDKSVKIDFFPDSHKWLQQNPPSEFCITQIKQYHCFVKRQKKKFQGWGLLVKAIGQRQISNTPKVMSIAKHNDYFYFFTEKLNGVTLESHWKNRTPIVVKNLVNSVYKSFYEINMMGFWYSDLCKKNVFCAQSNNYFLIDIDSCHPHTQTYFYEKVSFEYPPLLTEFARTIGGNKKFNINTHSGECVNQAELIAFAVDAKNNFQIPIDKKAKVINTLLNKNYGALYKKLFLNLMHGKINWKETKELLDKIID